MKALILAAGFGTRLLPYTAHTPKALFSYRGRPLLDRTINQLAAAGCSAVVVNAHHHHRRIAAHLAATRFALPVVCRVEQDILGTGGAIRNLADFWDRHPFMVINADVVSDIDLARVATHHRSHDHWVTLAMHHRPEFNTVAVDAGGRVVGFDADSVPAARRLAFTGIHVIDPRVLTFIPARGFAGIIDAYRRMLAAGLTLGAYEPPAPYYWEDIGTPRRYGRASFSALAAAAFDEDRPRLDPAEVETEPLAGDGSSRCWYRLRHGGRTRVMVDHGIRRGPGPLCEADAFVRIGGHLHSCGLPVPQIHAGDAFSGLVIVQDLGDCRLQDRIRSARGPRQRREPYGQAIELLVAMWHRGQKGFDPSWCWQTARYDRRVILQDECCYFVDAFLNGYRGRDVDPGTLAADFVRLADATVRHAAVGFMHRDFQSRNLMVHDGKLFAIDFQAGRLGPLQYDLASLLIDPYVGLPPDEQETLAHECFRQAAALRPLDAATFDKGYRLCRLTRNLQILGAFGFLSRVRGKAGFETHIPAALQTLKTTLAGELGSQFPALAAVAASL